MTHASDHPRIWLGVQRATCMDRIWSPLNIGGTEYVRVDLVPDVAAKVAQEKERIASALDYEATMTPDLEDAKVVQDCAALVRADFSYTKAFDADADSLAAKDAETARLRLIVDTIVPESGGFDPDKETDVQALALEWCKRFHGMREEVATLKKEYDDMHDTSRDKDAEIARLQTRTAELEQQVAAEAQFWNRHGPGADFMP